MARSFFRRQRKPEKPQEPAGLDYGATSAEFDSQLESWKKRMVDQVVGEKINFSEMTYFKPDVVERLMSRKRSRKPKDSKGSAGEITGQNGSEEE